eukprot:TRINITY_DN66544_c0_g1_i1.p1 TRINITY_DN66544_c0_g1~~TRINITY_DN66544_c0_g1_i1.p1  ORF type:complete len:577 (-),score=122.46 TRINITY_DN66544_c0_g1_i1:220-1950(-)
MAPSPQTTGTPSHQRRRVGLATAGLAVGAAGLSCLFSGETQNPGAFVAPPGGRRPQSAATRSESTVLGSVDASALVTTVEESLASQQLSTSYALGTAALFGGALVGLNGRSGLSATSTASVEQREASALQRRAGSSTEVQDVNYFALLFKGDLPKRILTVLLLLGLARVGFYIPLYGFDSDAVGEYFGRQATTNLGFVDQLFGGGLGRISLFSLGIGPYITSSIIFQILTTVTPALKALAQGEEGEAGREKYKGYIRQASIGFAFLQGFGQATSLAPFVFDNGPIFLAQVTLQLVFGAILTIWTADRITDCKLGQGTSLLVFSSIVANLPRNIASTVAKAGEVDSSYTGAAIFTASLFITIAGLVFILASERRIPVVFAKRLQDEASGQGATDDAGGSYLPIKLNASGVLPLIFAGSLLSLPALVANYTRAPWLQGFAQALLPGQPTYVPISMFLIAVFSYVSTFQVLNPTDMAKNLRRQAAAIPGVRPGAETEQYLRDVLSRSSVFGAVILAFLFVLPNVIESLTNLQTPNSFGGTSLLILVGVAADTWRQLQAELLMQQYATDVDKFYKGKNMS